MHQDPGTLPLQYWDDGYYDYQLVARPGPAVSDRIMEEKKQFISHYLDRPAFAEQPAIRVAGFFAPEAMENTLMRWIQRICSQQSGFDVTFNNFGGFPAHTLYLRIQDHGPFLRLMGKLRMLDQYIRPERNAVKAPELPPHLSIAGNLPVQIFEPALREYAQKTFHETSQLQGLSLLKRKNPTDAGALVNVFSFMPALSIV